MSNLLVRLRLVVAVGLLFLAGCGSSTPPLAPVSGTVAYRGQPLPGGIVVFSPDPAKGSSGPLATARIDSEGRFTLKTGDTPGAVAGWHRITVVCVNEHDPGIQGQKFAMPPSLIPERYRCADLSGLSREVRMDDKNEFHLNLD
jgi:hypothetical protein